VLNAGPTTFSAFHVIGALFDTAYADGDPKNEQHGMQTVTIPPGGGYMVELVVPEAGLYPFVTHSFAYTGKGALGLIKVGDGARQWRKHQHDGHGALGQLCSGSTSAEAQRALLRFCGLDR